MTLSNTDIDKILEQVKPYSMVHESGVRFTIEQTIRIITENLPGVFVECGVWRGGCSLAMLITQRMLLGKVERPVYMLDSFLGLPAVDERDGPLAQAWQQGADPQKFFDNCKVAEADLHQVLAAFQFKEPDCYLVKGWFDETVAKLASQFEAEGKKIALLRLDGDWYRSTEICLKHLAPLVVEEGTVIVDDYYAWDGCARAVHDYLAEKGLPYRIKSLYNNYGGYFIKREFRNSFEVF